MGAVQLLWAEAGMHPSGTGSYSYYASIQIAVENFAGTKAVGVWGRQFRTGSWMLYPGNFERDLDGGHELWSVPMAGPPIDRFAIRYDVGGTSIWDNNGGFDYYLDAAAAQQEDGVGTVVSPAPVLVPAVDPAGVAILVQNLAYAKQVGVRCTTDHWHTWFDVPASYVRSFAPLALPSQPAVESWRAIVSDGGVPGEFAAFYRVAGQTYWDNNFGQNYRF